MIQIREERAERERERAERERQRVFEREQWEAARAERDRAFKLKEEVAAVEIAAIKASSDKVMELANSAISLAQNSLTKSNENAEAIQELRTGLNKTNEDCAETKKISQRAVQTTVELRSELQIFQSQKFEMSPEVQRMQEKLVVIDKVVKTQVQSTELLWR